jgi:hypothetical protein
MPYAKTLDPSLRVWVRRTLAPLLLLISHVKSEPDHNVYSLRGGTFSDTLVRRKSLQIVRRGGICSMEINSVVDTINSCKHLKMRSHEEDSM